MKASSGSLAKITYLVPMYQYWRCQFYGCMPP